MNNEIIKKTANETASPSDIIFQWMRNHQVEKVEASYWCEGEPPEIHEIIATPDKDFDENLEAQLTHTAVEAIDGAFPGGVSRKSSGIVEFTLDDATGAGSRIRIINFVPTGSEVRTEISLFPEFPEDYSAEVAGVIVRLAGDLPTAAAYRAEINRLMSAFKMDLIEVEYDLDDEKRAIGGISYVREGARAGGLKGVLQAPADDRAARFASAYLERVLTLFVQKFFEENGGGLSGRGTELPGSGMMSIAPAANRELLVDLTHQHRIVTTMEIAHSFGWDVNGNYHSTHRLA